MDNPYREIWRKYSEEINEFKKSYSHFENQEMSKIAKLALAYLNFISTPFSISTCGVPFVIDYSKIKTLELLDLIIFYSNDISDYQDIVDNCEQYMDEADNFVHKGYVFDSIQIIPFCDIVNNIIEGKNIAVMDLSFAEYEKVIDGYSPEEHLMLSRIEHARGDKFETFYYDLNNGDDDGVGDSFCCILNKEPKYCKNIRFYCKQIKLNFIEAVKTAEKFFY